jgi:glycosyltransferase involved in cell wall biosynthesis
MRILFNTYSVAFDCPGGGEVQLIKSREALERAGVQVLLYDIWHPQFDKVDAVHYFSVQGGSSSFCAYAKQRGLPLLISPIIWLTEENVHEMPLAEIRYLLGISDLILPNSKTEADQLFNFFSLDPGKFVVTHNGIDETFSERVPGDLFKEHFGQKEPFVLNVANLESRKNQLALIRAMRGLGIDLVLLGNVRFSSYFEECMKEGADFVRYLGYVDHDSDLLKSAYAACETFVLPSTLETPGLAALEAAASGAKLVVTSVGSTQEYFKDMATYVDPRSVLDIRQGVVKSLKEPKNDWLRSYVLENFTWNHTAARLTEAYIQVAGKL